MLQLELQVAAFAGWVGAIETSSSSSESFSVNRCLFRDTNVGSIVDFENTSLHVSCEYFKPRSRMLHQIECS